MDLSYEELCELNHFFNTQTTLPTTIAAINDKLTAYFAQPSRDIPNEDAPENAEDDGGEDAFYTNEDSDPNEGPADLTTPNE